MTKTYLGDGVYVEVEEENGLMLKLTTEDGVETTNVIYLEPEVLDTLGQFVRAWMLERQRPSNG